MPVLLRAGLSILALPLAFASIALSIDAAGWRGLAFFWIVPTALVAASAVIGWPAITALLAAPLGWYAPQAGWVELPDDFINLAILVCPVVLVLVALVAGLVRDWAGYLRRSRPARS